MSRGDSEGIADLPAERGAANLHPIRPGKYPRVLRRVICGLLSAFCFGSVIKAEAISQDIPTPAFLRVMRASTSETPESARVRVVHRSAGQASPQHREGKEVGGYWYS